MKSEIRCESCSMPIESGPYCEYCTDEHGNLQAFDERFERMVQWVVRQKPDTPRADAEKQTVEFMGTMPAWKDHPALAARRAQYR